MDADTCAPANRSERKPSDLLRRLLWPSPRLVTVRQPRRKERTRTLGRGASVGPAGCSHQVRCDGGAGPRAAFRTTSFPVDGQTKSVGEYYDPRCGELAEVHDDLGPDGQSHQCGGATQGDLRARPVCLLKGRARDMWRKGLSRGECLSKKKVSRGEQDEKEK